MMTEISMLMMAYSSMLKNPMKMCMHMLPSSLLMMVALYAYKSKAWMSLVIFLLFLGGIVMMFMMLSSTMPNQAAGKSSNTFLYATTIFMVISMWSYETWSSEETKWQLHPTKSVFENSSSISSMTLIMILYFSVYTYLLGKNKLSMREF